jgi:hypothetical protein
MPEFHIYVPAGLAESQDVHIHITPPDDQGHDDLDQQDLDGTVETVLRQMQARASASPHLRNAAEGLLARGYRLITSKPQTPGATPQSYLRFMDPLYGAHGTGVLHPNFAEFTRGEQLEQLSRLPGAQLRKDTVRFSITAGVEQALAAAELAKT